MATNIKSSLLATCLLVLSRSVALLAILAGAPEDMSQGAPAQTAQFSTASDGIPVVVPEGTDVEIELTCSISSQLAQRGDLVDFTVVRPVLVNGVTAIERGALAIARITKVRRTGYLGRAGQVSWELQYVVAKDGSHIPLSGERRVKGEGRALLIAGATVVSSVGFPPSALFWGLRKGDPAVVPARARFWVYTAARSFPTPAK